MKNNKEMPDVTKATMTPQDVNQYRLLYPNVPKIQAITLAELIANTPGVNGNWNDPLPSNDAFRETRLQMAATGISKCEMAIGWVVFDCVCLALGAVGLRGGASSSTIEGIAKATAPVASKIEIIIAKMGAEGASKSDLATGMFEILKIIFNGGCFGAVFSAFVGSLSWWDAALYGVTGTATIIAALTTDGVAFIAEVIIILATVGFLASDSVKAVSACSIN